MVEVGGLHVVDVEIQADAVDLAQLPVFIRRPDVQGTGRAIADQDFGRGEAGHVGQVNTRVPCAIAIGDGRVIQPPRLNRGDGDDKQQNGYPNGQSSDRRPITKDGYNGSRAKLAVAAAPLFCT